MRSRSQAVCRFRDTRPKAVPWCLPFATKKFFLACRYLWHPSLWKVISLSQASTECTNLRDGQLISSSRCWAFWVQACRLDDFLVLNVCGHLQECNVVVLFPWGVFWMQDNVLKYEKIRHGFIYSRKNVNTPWQEWAEPRWDLFHLRCILVAKLFRI